MIAGHPLSIHPINMKIKLIAPHEHRADTISSPFKLQRVNLPLLAALTPPGHTITMVEEAFAPDDIHQEVDLVGISVLTDLLQEPIGSRTPIAERV